MLAMSAAGQAAGQVVERHLPPDPPVAAPAPLAEQDQSAQTDDRPIGPKLTAIIVLSGDEPAGAGPNHGVRIGRLAPLRHNQLVRRLTPFLDQPLSRALIAKVVAAVTRGYRRAGHPFVSVTTPAQELTAGKLILRVVEFRAGRLLVRAPSDTSSRSVSARLRFPAGEWINSQALQQDLGWLDRDPFRRTGAVFSPGEFPATTDLTVTVANTKPWQVFGGLSSSDAPSSGNVRLFAGAIVGGLTGPNSLISAQVTASSFDKPEYLGVAARFVQPLSPRHELSLVTGYVRGRLIGAPFSSQTQTAQGALDFRFALPASLPGDGHIGVEFGRQWLDARFGSAPIYSVRATTLAVFAEYSMAAPIHHGAVSANVSIHVSPGGIGTSNTADHLFYGRLSDGSATYAYVTADASIDQSIGRNLNWQTRMMLQASFAPLPALDQIGLGGSSYVRGYTLDDGGYDAAIIVRNMLTLKRQDAAGRFLPYVLTDWGCGHYFGRAHQETFGSVGGGVSETFGNNLRLQIEAALPLLDGPRTKAVHPRLFAQASVAF